jgi:hypothetical protein
MAVGYPKNSYGYSIYRYNSSTARWIIMPGSAVRITVDRTGNPWVINSKSKVFRYHEDKWKMLEGSGFDIGAGPDGSVFLVSSKRN